MKTLIFATAYENTEQKAQLHDMWIKLHSTRNPYCDLLIVDSDSPTRPNIKQRNSYPMPWHKGKRTIFSFPDNIGHLEHPVPLEKDGWGRAFCFGLQHAINNNYHYVAHIEGDSLTRLYCMDIFQNMAKHNLACCSVAGKVVETGLMFFNVDYIKKIGLIEKYDWKNLHIARAYGGHPYGYGEQFAGPERIILNIIDKELTRMNWSAFRGYKGKITYDNCLGFDWITHCQDHRIYKKYSEYYINNT